MKDHMPRETICRQTSNTRPDKSQNSNASRLVLQLSLPNLWSQVLSRESEDVAGAAPTGDAPTTSEWSTTVLPIKVRLILEAWRLLNNYRLHDTDRNGTNYLYSLSSFSEEYPESDDTTEMEEGWR